MLGCDLKAGAEHLKRACVSIHAAATATGEGQGIWDIEEFRGLGDHYGGCPYYASRALAGSAQLIICPVNYVLDPHERSRLGIRMHETIFVIDEGHQIETTARDAGSVVLMPDVVRLHQGSLTEIGLTDLGNHYERLADWLEFEAPKAQTTKKNPSVALTSLDINGLLAAVFELDPLSPDFNEQMDARLVDMAVHMRQLHELSEAPATASATTTGAAEMTRSLWILWSQLGGTAAHREDYCVAVRREEIPKGKFTAISHRLTCDLLNPAVVTQALAGARSVIITSGTLSPLDAFAAELGIPFPVVHVADHIIQDEQLAVFATGVGVAGGELVGTFQFNTTLPYQTEVGATLLRIAESVPNGMLVFMPSYSVIDSFMTAITMNGTYMELAKAKTIYVEARKTADFKIMLAAYRAAATGPKGAIMFAPYNGKASEGVDFKDDEARVVVCVGIPFPPVTDPTVVAKRAYNDRKSYEGPHQTGEAWYTTQSARSVNQAVGRVIRHKDDYGAIVLLDKRYPTPAVIARLPGWIRSRVTQPPTATTVVTELQQFFTRRRALRR